MLRSFFRFSVTASVLAVVVGFGWIAFGEVNESEAAHADASFALVSHQTQQIGASLEGAGTFIDAEVSVDIGRITDVTALLDEWTPKYQRAETGYRKFDTAINAAEDSADAYLLAQRALTARIHDQELGALARADDEAEAHQYRRWRVGARGIRAEALEIMHRLGDMEATLQKLKLRSDFLFDPGALSEVPSDILELEKELAQFRVDSDTLREIIGSTFDATS